MMVQFALQIVCFFAFLDHGVLGAPTVTYDQRQNGEFNLQVDLEDVAILLLPSSEFAQRNLQILDGLHNKKLYQIFGRRNGIGLKNKHHKKPTAVNYNNDNYYNNSTTTAEYPELPYSSELPPTASFPASQKMQSSQENLQGVVPEITETEVNIPVDDKKFASDDYDPYSVTPSTPNFTGTGPEGVYETNCEEMVAVKTIEKPVASTTVETMTDFAETIVVRNVEMDATVLKMSDDAKADIKPIETGSSNPEEKLLKSDTKTTETVKTEKKATPAYSKTAEDNSNEMTTIKIAEKSEKVQDNANITYTEPNLKVEDKPAVMIAMRTVEKPNADVKAAAGATNVNVNNSDTQVNTKKHVEMIAKENTTFGDALKDVKKPVDADTAVKRAVTEAGIMSAVSSEKPAEMVAMKTIEKPSSFGSTAADTMEKSGITTSTKLVEIQEDKKKTPSKTPFETVVSRTASKPTEMVAVKTMENPATTATVKSVISVKTVVKPGTPKTTLLLNGTSIMRKVGDRKPLPLITLEVASPKVI